MDAELPITDESADVGSIPALAPKPGGLGMMRLRDYQNEATDCVYEAWQEYNAVMAVLATGLGKTVLAAEVIIRWPGTKRILFLAHVRELIHQAKEKIGLHTDETPAVEMGMESELREDRRIVKQSQVLVASIQTFSRRKHKFCASDFDLVIIDEFHHASANTYRAIWAWLQAGNPNIKLLGITATPDRADGTSLACIAEHCAFDMGIREGIDDGWLVPIRQQYIVVDGLDFSKCRTLAKDLNEKDLEETMMGGVATDDMTPEQRQEILEKQERMMHAVAVPAIQEAQGRQGLVYCVTVNHAERMAEIFRRYPGVTAELIHGGTPHDERLDLMNRFKGGSLQWLVNVGVITEGVDVPGAHVIVMARPTKSRALYTQMVGRATRAVPGLVDRYDAPELRQEAIANSVKPFSTVLDFVGNSGKHKLISTADVLAGDMPEAFVEAAIEEMRETGETADIRAKAWQKKQEHDDEIAKRQAEEKRKAEERQKEIQAREEARRARLRAEAEYRSKQVDPFNKHDVVAERAQPEFRGGASDAQVRLLGRLGIKPDTAMKWSKKQAGAVISDLKSRSGGRFIIQFGKHQGKSLESVPVDYLRWAGENIHHEDFQKNLELYRQEWRDKRKAGE